MGLILNEVKVALPRCSKRSATATGEPGSGSAEGVTQNLLLATKHRAAGSVFGSCTGRKGTVH